MAMTFMRAIRPGERIEYRIVRRVGIHDRYRVQYRNPDVPACLRDRRWWQFWYWGTDRGQWRTLMTSGMYYNYEIECSTCHDAEVIIDADVRERIGMSEGWVPVTCVEDGARNHGG